MIDLVEAQSKFCLLVKAIEDGVETEILIARHGRPAARLVPIAPATPGKRIGVAKGRFTMPDDIDGDDDEIARLFYEDGKP